MAIPANLRRLVIHRAKQCCEYCGLSQAGQEAVFHIDHIVPTSAQGETELSNLALACVSCSLRKAAQRHGTDPETGQKVRLYNPRQAAWHLHFRWYDGRVLGLTPAGRATVAALKMNRPIAVAIRREEIHRGRNPVA